MAILYMSRPDYIIYGCILHRVLYSPVVLYGAVWWYYMRQCGGIIWCSVVVLYGAA